MQILRVIAFTMLVLACHHHRGGARVPGTGDDGPDWAALVDPLIGTADDGKGSPAAALPFGMMQWGPDTAGAESGYRYNGDAIGGFSLAHLNGAGCAALEDFPFIPTTLPVDPASPGEPERYRAPFDHADERASPGSYAVKLRSGTTVRLAVTARTGVGELTFAAPRGALVVLAGKLTRSRSVQVEDGEVRVVGDRGLEGWLISHRFCGQASTYRVHFAAEVDRPFAASGTWRRGDRTPAGAVVAFDTARAPVVRIKVALSYVSVAGARANLRAEATTWDVGERARDARAIWNRRLGQIAVEGGTPAERRTFYTALYHSFLHPNVTTDADGAYTGYDGRPHASAHPLYGNVSGWDVYRSWVQLAALLAPRETGDVVRSLMVAAAECGGMPRWPLATDETGTMVGDAPALIVAGAHAFGARGFDARAALARLAADASRPEARCNAHLLRKGLADYLERGYCPADAPGGPWGPASTTLEYAVADFAIARLAAELGARDVAAAFTRRSGNWRAVFNPETGYVQPRLRDGSWRAPFDPSDERGFVEGNAAQYTFFVPHDLPGLIGALGGPQRAVERLDRLFEHVNTGAQGARTPHFWMGNEPQFSTPWIYNFAGAPAKTQAIVRRLLRETFSDRPDGIPGNDDLGATSSWFVWGALGLYPAVPAVGGVTVAAPLFPAASIRLGNGRVVRVEAVPGPRGGGPYVEALIVDGQRRARAWIGADELLRGARVQFVVGPAPAAWGEPPPAFM